MDEDIKYLDNVVNRLHQSILKLTIADIPVSFSEPDAPPSEILNATILGFVAPGLSIRYATDSSYKAKVHIPMQEDNEYNDKILAVTMVADDRLQNYWSLYRWMRTIQSGQTDGFPVKDRFHRVFGKDGMYRNRLLWAPFADIIIADGSYQRFGTIRYGRIYPLNMTDIDFHNRSSDQVTFNVAFIFSDRDIFRESLPTDKIVPPLSAVD